MPGNELGFSVPHFMWNMPVVIDLLGNHIRLSSDDALITNGGEARNKEGLYVEERVSQEIDESSDDADVASKGVDSTG